MIQKQLLESIARLIKKEVDKEIQKQMTTIRAEIISEVAGMLNYSERKLLSQLSEYRETKKSSTDTPVEGDFEQSMRNLKSMSAYNHITEKVAPRPTPKAKFTSDDLLNDILNETTGFTRDEGNSGTGLSSLMDFGGAGRYEEPWNDNESSGFDDEVLPSYLSGVKHQNPVSQESNRYGGIINPGDAGMMVGTDMKPIDFSNPTVQKVLDIMNGTNHKEKLDEINKAGEIFRGTAVSAPRYNSKYFEEQSVD